MHTRSQDQDGGSGGERVERMYEGKEEEEEEEGDWTNGRRRECSGRDKPQVFDMEAGLGGWSQR